MIAPNLDSPLNILLAVDDSPHSAAAVNLLTHISWPARTRIHVLAIAPKQLPLVGVNSEIYSEVGGGCGEDFRKFGQIRGAIRGVSLRTPLSAQNFEQTLSGAMTASQNRTNVETLAAQAAARLRAHDLTVETEFCEGRPSQVILERAMKLLTNLIVIGANGFNASDELPLGRTAYRLAHYTHRSLLVARPWKQARPLSIILAVDNSPEAWQAVELLCALSLPDWAKVTVIGVAEEEMSIPADTGFKNRQFQTSSQQAILDTTEAHIAKVVERLHECGAQVRRIICCGHPANRILDAAQEQEAVLIVVGARGQTRVDPFQLGNVTQKIVHYAPCSVLTVE